MEVADFKNSDYSFRPERLPICLFPATSDPIMAIFNFKLILRCFFDFFVFSFSFDINN